MVCDGPDPPENNPNELIPPPRHEMINGHGEDSDDERNEHFGYQPLPQGPDTAYSDRDFSDDDAEQNELDVPQNNLPPIVSMEAVFNGEIWNAPSNSESIEMNNERAEQVMSAMANFALPHTSIPEWAQSVNEEQWKETLKDRIEKMKSNR